MIFLLLLFFGIFSSGIIVTSYFSINSIKAISRKFKLSETFIGTSFLAIGTSFPEFVNAIVAGFHDGSYDAAPTYAIYSFYNITGSNIWQIVFLSVLLGSAPIYFSLKNRYDIYEKINNTFWEKNMLSWKLVLGETVLLLAIFLFPHFFSRFNFNQFNLINLPFVFIWIWHLYTTYMDKQALDNEEVDEINFFDKLDKKPLIFSSFFLWLAFGSFSYGNFYICTLFEHQLNIPGNVALGVILSFITSMPEFCAFYFLFRKKEYLIAVSGLFGSSLFNLTLPAYTNLLSYKPLFGNDWNGSISGQAFSNNHLHQKVHWWLLLNIVLSVLFLLIFIFKWSRWKIGAVFNVSFIVLVYVFSTYLISTMV